MGWKQSPSYTGVLLVCFSGNQMSRSTANKQQPTADKREEKKTKQRGLAAFELVRVGQTDNYSRPEKSFLVTETTDSMKDCK